MQKIKVWVLVALFAVTMVSYAKDAVIVYGNGVANTEQDTEDSMEALKKVIKNDLDFANSNLEFDYAYNQTSCIPGGLDPDLGCLFDIWESVRQETISIDPEEFWVYLAQVRSEPEEEFELLTEVANSTASRVCKYFCVNGLWIT